MREHCELGKKQECTFVSTQYDLCSRGSWLCPSDYEMHSDCSVINQVVFCFQDHICIATEFCPGGSLFELTRNHEMTEVDAAFYLACVVLGLEFLHSRNIVHR
jgi:serine/threonine protein kinase